jgi:hypothetical protein
MITITFIIAAYFVFKIDAKRGMGVFGMAVFTGFVELATIHSLFGSC